MQRSHDRWSAAVAGTRCRRTPRGRRGRAAGNPRWRVRRLWLGRDATGTRRRRSWSATGRARRGRRATSARLRRGIRPTGDARALRPGASPRTWRAHRRRCDGHAAAVPTCARRATRRRSGRDRRDGGARGAATRRCLTATSAPAPGARAGRRGASSGHRPEPRGAERDLERQEQQGRYDEPACVLVPGEDLALLERGFFDVVDFAHDVGEGVLVGGAVVRTPGCGCDRAQQLFVARAEHRWFFAVRELAALVLLTHAAYPRIRGQARARAR